MARYGRSLPPRRLIRPQLIYPTYPVGKYGEEVGKFDDQESHVIPLTAWRYRRLITIDHTKIDANLTDYPVPVLLSAANFDFGKALPNGQDVVFVSNDGSNTVLQFERERYSDSLKLGNFWVRLPSVLTASDTTFWMYYGNDNSADYQNPTDVWDQYYTGVYHLSQDGGVSAPQFIDSTSINNVGGSSTGLTGMSRQEAIFAQGQLFDGSTSNINIGRLNTVRSATQYTVSAWVTITATGAQRVIVEEARGQQDATTRFKFAIDGSQHFSLFGVDVDTNAYRTLASNTSVTATADGAWFFVTAVYDSTNDTNFVTVNGTKATTTDTGNLPISNTVPMGDTTIGRRTDLASEFWSGKMDEVRISGTARSDAWIKADYNGGLGTLLSVGSEIGADQAITDFDRGRFSDIVTPTTAYVLPLVFNFQTLLPPVTPIGITRPDTGTSVESNSAIGVTTATQSGTATETTSIAATLSSADTGSGTEGVGVISVTSSDTGSGAESGSVNTGVTPISSSDTGTGTEGTPTIGVTSVDIGADAETSSIAVTFSSADTGSGVEGTASIGVTSTDTGTRTETTSIAATLTSADTGVGADVGTIGVSSSDISTSTETTSLATPITSSDTGSSTEANAPIDVSGSGSADTSTGTETISIAATLSSSDTGTGVEGTGSIAVSSADTGSGAETSSIAVTLPGSDTGSGSEGTGTVAQSVADTGTSVEVGKIAVTGTDTGSGTENTLTLVATFTTVDTSTGVEGTPNVGVAGSDTGTNTNTSSLVVQATDTGAGTEGTGAIALSAADTSTSVDNGSVTGTGANPSDSDTGSATETTSIVATLSSADTGVGVEGTPVVALSFSDTGSGVEGTGVIAVSASDTGSTVEAVVTLNVLANDLRTSTETTSIVATLATSDTGSATDAGSPAATFSSSDTGSASEGIGNVGVSSNDLRTSVESGVTTATVSANDFVSAVEALSSLLANLSSSDSSTGVEAWVVDTGHIFTWTFRLANGSWQFDSVVLNWQFEQVQAGDTEFPSVKVAYAFAGTKAADS